MLNQVKRALEPSLSLPETFLAWETISAQFADPPRKRKPQLASHFD